ncbi:MAG: type II toxin-antitoxin system RelE/ParE family toxin [Leptolyngbya sp. SIO4C1]|nr:type II toxin-antitoxin system RelE/ParE family toxin [Leptolyngbya sp. SIO4C1]
MQRLAAFIGPKNPDAAKRAVDRILQAVATIADMPGIGVSLPSRPQYSEHTAHFGKGAYIIRYRVKGQQVVIVRIWHSRENRPR